MGLWNRELRLSQGLRCAWILLHLRLRMEKSMNELRRCKWLKDILYEKNRHEKNGDAHLTGLWDRYVRLQCLRYSWVLLHARRLYNQSINEDDENDSRTHSNLKMKKELGGQCTYHELGESHVHLTGLWDLRHRLFLHLCINELKTEIKNNGRVKKTKKKEKSRLRRYTQRWLSTSN